MKNIREILKEIMVESNDNKDVKYAVVLFGGSIGINQLHQQNN